MADTESETEAGGYGSGSEKSLPSLVGSFSSSDTDSDEEDYRQLEAQERARDAPPADSRTLADVLAATTSRRRGSLQQAARQQGVWEQAVRRLSAGLAAPLSSLAEDPVRTDSATRAVRSTNTAARRHVRETRETRSNSDSDESLPELVASSMSSAQDSDDDEPRRARNSNNRTEPFAAAPMFIQRQRDDYGFVHSNGQSIPSTQYPASTATRPVDPPFEAGSRNNARVRSTSQSLWNSDAAPRAGFQASRPGMPQMHVQMVGGNGGTLWMDGGGMTNNVRSGGRGGAGARAGRPANLTLRLGPMGVLSAIMGSQLQLDGNSEVFGDIRDMPLDPILQVLQASFNLPPLRKPEVCQDALESVLIVRARHSYLYP